MDSVDEATLKLLYPDIFETLDGAAIANVCRIFVSENVLKCNLAKEEILHLSKVNVAESLKQLLGIMPSCGSKAFYTFVSALETLKFFDLAEKIQNKNTELRHKQGLIAYNWTVTSTPNPIPYSVRSQPHRGKILVINHSVFASPLMTIRNGSQKSIEDIERTFRPLGYHITTAEDKLTKNDMFVEVTQFLNDYECDAVGMVIMSHGCDTGIYDCEGNIVELTYLLEPFMRSKHPNNAKSSLQHKPVFVIVQACRSSRSDDCKFVVNENQPEVFLATEPRKLQSNVVNLPTMEDTIIVYSAMVGEVCYRREDIGSIFIHSMCKVVSECAKQMPFQKMLPQITELNKRLQSENLIMRPTDPQVSNGMSRDFYFDTSVMEN